MLIGKGIYKSKGSKFLSFAETIQSEEEAKALIARYKKRYHDARHVCYAYRLGANLWRTKDDGEPLGFRCQRLEQKPPAVASSDIQHCVRAALQQF